MYADLISIDFVVFLFLRGFLLVFGFGFISWAICGCVNLFRAITRG